MRDEMMVMLRKINEGGEEEWMSIEWVDLLCEAFREGWVDIVEGKGVELTPAGRLMVEGRL